MSDKEFMWALKNGDLDEVKDYVAKETYVEEGQENSINHLNVGEASAGTSLSQF